MAACPFAFLSTVTHEVGTFRDDVEDEIEMKGGFAGDLPIMSIERRETERSAMTPDTEGMHEIAKARDVNRTADIVFVHGLAGGLYENHGMTNEQ